MAMARPANCLEMLAMSKTVERGESVALAEDEPAILDDGDGEAGGGRGVVAGEERVDAGLLRGEGAGGEREGEDGGHESAHGEKLRPARPVVDRRD
jgi:hypothetical protein